MVCAHRAGVRVEDRECEAVGREETAFSGGGTVGASPVSLMVDGHFTIGTRTSAVSPA